MPRKDEDEKTLSVDDKFELLIAALTARQTDNGLTKEDLKAILTETAQVSAQSMQKALKPENDTHPGISSFSYPEGDRAKPREGILQHEVWWNNFPLHKAVETHHYRELELLAQLQPGEYSVMRKDGSLWPEKAEVIGTRNASGRLTKIEFKLSIHRGEKDQAAPLFVMAYQMVHADRPLRQTFFEAMTEWMQITVAEEPVPVH